MNKHIEQLALKATTYIWRQGSGTDVCFDAETFAELIAKECIDLLSKPEYAMKHPNEFTGYNLGWVNGRLLGIEYIKDHFGLKQ